ncbi:MAG: hypothetical protein GY930_02605 [bacterium]|nr:hypothetical protein [bacterium]
MKTKIVSIVVLAVIASAGYAVWKISMDSIHASGLKPSLQPTSTDTAEADPMVAPLRERSTRGQRPAEGEVPDKPARVISAEKSEEAADPDGLVLEHQHRALPEGKFVDDDGHQELIDETLYIYHEDSDALSEAGPWIDGMREGFWESFSEEGSLILSGAYLHGKATGQWNGWYNAGTRSVTGGTLNGKYHGQVTFWLPNGRVDASRTGIYESGVKID